MRWFTHDWHSGGLTEVEAQQVVQQYWQHIDQIHDRIAGRADELARLNLHDGWVLSYSYNDDSFTWSLLIGDLQAGYEIVTLTYENARLNLALQDLDRMNLASEEVEVLYDEIDLAGGDCLHRLSFWPSGELHITFTAASVARVPVSERRRN